MQSPSASNLIPRTRAKCCLIVLAALLFCSFPMLFGLSDGALLPAASAAESTSGYYTYEVSSSNTAKIKKVSSDISGSVTIPSSLGGYPVTVIDSSAFKNCTSMTYVTIPNSVTIIEDYAFQYCSGLTGVSIGSGVTSIEYEAFYGCSGLQTLTIPNNVTNIGSYAFYECTRLSSVTIGTGVTAIPNNCFGKCSNLESVSIGANVTTIGSSAFSGLTALRTINWGSSLRTIGENAFKNCTGLTGTLKIPNTVTIIEDYAFQYCSGLTGVTIGTGVTSIEYEAFYGCSGLQSLSIPNNVTNMGSYAFYECSRLTSVTIGTGLNTIPNNCFGKCSNLASVTIGANVTTIGSSAFSGLTALKTINWGNSLRTIGENAFKNCTGLTGTLKIPNTVTIIEDYAFQYCSGLTGVTIGTGVTSIEYEAFYGCSGLQSLSIPNNVTNIGSYAFYECTRLSSVTIGTGLISIPNNCFGQCSNLESVTIGANVTSIGSSAFSGLTALKTINWGSSLRTIGENAFKNCTGLTGTLTIPNTVTIIEDYAFQYCTGLTGLEVGTGVTSIEYEAFYGCSGLTSVQMSYSGVTTVGGYAFYDCKKITWVAFPGSLQSIGNSAFNNCSALTDVYYASTSTDWGYVTVNSGNDPIVNATKHYNSHGPTTTTKYTVSFSANGGSGAPASVTVNAGASITLPSGPSTPKSYTVVFNPNGGSVSPTSKTYLCSFAGWTYNGSTYSVGAVYTPKSSMTFTAKWKDPLASGMPTPTRSDYSFDGWYTASSGGTKYTSSTTISDSITLYAHWTLVPVSTTYTVSFNGNGGTNVPGSVTVDAGSSVTLPSNVLKKFPNTFLGWSTGSAATSASYLPGGSFTPTKNTPLYAVWQTPATVSVSKTVTANIAFNNQWIYYKIVPAASGTLTVYSTSSYDTYGHLFSSGESQLTYDDDSGDGNNFRYTYNVTAGTTYYAAVRRYSTGTGAISVHFELPAAQTIDPPATVSAKASGDKRITVSWSAVSGATQYNVYRYNGSEQRYVYKGTTFATAAKPTQYIDADHLVAGVTYYYRVKAVYKTSSVTIVSKFSNEATAKAVTAPAAPKSVKAFASGEKQITITWASVSDATQYNIYRYNASKEKYVYRGTTFANPTNATNQPSTQYVDEKLSAGTTYYYKVVAVRKTANYTLVSAMSASVNAKAVGLPAVPGGVRAVAGTKQVTVSWNAVSGATQYNVYRYNGTSKCYKYIGTSFASDANPTRFVNTGLTAGTTYYYKVVAVKKTSNYTLVGEFSAAASAKAK